jgi:VWFA-related protein
MRLGGGMALAVGAGVVLASFAASAAETVGRRTVDRGGQFGPGAAQGNSAEAPTIQINSRETVVDVIVTDKDGQPVHGLTQADFTIKENGKEQAIQSFKEFGDEAATPQPTQLQQPVSQPVVYSNAREMPASGPVNILLIDAVNASAGMVMRVQRETVKYLKAMPEGTRMAIFLLSPGGLHMLRDFTSDRKLLIGAVSRPLLAPNRLEGWTRMWVTVDAMDEIAVYVSSIKGRKNLLWITPGMPVMLLRDGGYAWGGPPDMGLVHRLMDAYELLSRAQVAISPIDPRGVVGLGMAQLKVEAVAEDTGGEAFYNNNDLKSLIARAVDDQSHFYTLSYIPPGKKDDNRYHHIWVGVDRPGMHLVYRKGYDSEDPLAANAVAPGPGLKKAVMAGRAMADSEMQFDVKVMPVPVEDGAPSVAAQRSQAGRRVLPKFGAKPGVKYGFIFTVPASEITFTQGSDGVRTASLEFDVTAHGTNGAITNMVSERIKLPLSSEEYEEFVKTPFHNFQKLDVPAGEAMIQVGIRDDVSKKAGTIEIPLTVSKDVGMAEAGK